MGKEKNMSNHQNNRVLSRMGARELTSQEIAQVSGGFFTEKLTGPLPNGRYDVIFDH
jgi:hypothetical protein